MRLHAFLKDNIVEKVEAITEDQYVEQAKNYQLIIDVHDYVSAPAAGWVLSGNVIVPSPAQQPSIKQIVKDRIFYYQKQAPDLLVDLYADNTLLGITTAQSSQMFTDFTDVLLCVSQGAFPTAVYKLQQKQPSGFVTQEMINDWIAKIQSKMI